VRWKFWLPALLAAITLPFAIGYAVAVLVLFPAPEVVAVGIPVPELVGLRADQAEARLREAGLGGLEITELPHPDRAAGVVMAQSPLPGQQLRAGAAVRVAVSSGPPRAVVPDIIGFSAERAAELLTRLGFDVLRQDEESEEALGRVLAIQPAPGSERELPATVTLVVSAGLPLPPDTFPRVDTLAWRGAPAARPLAAPAVFAYLQTNSGT
jgi:serine/threonine-protein kinase